MKKIAHYLKKIVRWLLPHVCIFCGYSVKGNRDLCRHCFDDLPHLHYVCPGCAKPLSGVQQNVLCGSCLNAPLPFDSVQALYIYQAPIAKLITDLKFGHALPHARILGELLADKIQFQWYFGKSMPEVIIPMPLHPTRLKERGFNQALEIARPIARALNVPLEYLKCQRIKETLSSTKLKAALRKKNVKNAFHITGRLPYQHVAVIDDVMTTGATIIEFCHTLKRSGVRKIDVWCCARTEF